MADDSAIAPRRRVRIAGDALRRSLKYTLLAWIPGAFWMGATGSTSITTLGQYLGANDLVFALLTTAGPLASALLQIPGALVVERLRARKRFFIWTVTPHRTLYILVGLLPWLLPAHQVGTAMVMAAIVFVSMGLNNFGGQAWVNWMADLVPPRVRGKYFARRSRMGVAVIALAGLLVGFIMDAADAPWAAGIVAPLTRGTSMPPVIALVSVVFMLAGAVGMLDILAFTRVDEPPMRTAPAEPLAARLARPLRDTRFMRFVTYWSCWTMANSWCTWFWTPYFLDFFARHKAALAASGTHTWWENHVFLVATLILPVGFQIGQFLGYPMWGRAVDRFGRKPVFLVSSALHTLTWLCWAFLSPTLLPWMLPIQIAGGMIGGGQDIASFNMMLHFNRKGGPGYQAAGTVIFSLAGAVSAFTAGALATALTNFQWTFAPGTPWEHTFNRYAVLIVIGAAMKYASDLLVLPLVQDVAAKPASRAMRFVFDNLYGTLNTLIFEPLRSGIEAAGSGLKRWWR